ncbi:MAG: phospholipase D family protein [Flavobacteriales bacterium]|nr:phospholipase D family protein [Flavobacteriales bacterium]
MSVSFLQAGLWRELTTAIKRSRGMADVAVAYFGADGAGLLPLRKGSRLVVDASLDAVKSGQTHPGALLKLYRQGVAIFNKPGLHAKVFIVGKKAYVGSANASRHSAHTLIEAAMVSDNAKTVRQVRAFIDELALHELGEEQLKGLIKIYRPPKNMVGERQARASATKGPRVWITRITIGDLPEAFEDIHEEEGRVARKLMEHPRRHVQDDFWWAGDCPYAKGDIVVQVVRERGVPNRVRPPGTVLHMVTHVQNGQRKTFVYLEMPNKRQKLETVFAKQIGAGARGIRPGPLGKSRAERVLRAWNSAAR